VQDFRGLSFYQPGSGNILEFFAEAITPEKLQRADK
jgi:hypothetical protein